jgi:hypothetical protein
MGHPALSAVDVARGVGGAVARRVASAVGASANGGGTAHAPSHKRPATHKLADKKRCFLTGKNHTTPHRPANRDRLRKKTRDRPVIDLRRFRNTRRRQDKEIQVNLISRFVLAARQRLALTGSASHWRKDP